MVCWPPGGNPRTEKFRSPADVQRVAGESTVHTFVCTPQTFMGDFMGVFGAVMGADIGATSTFAFARTPVRPTARTPVRPNTCSLVGAMARLMAKCRPYFSPDFSHHQGGRFPPPSKVADRGLPCPVSPLSCWGVTAVAMVLIAGIAGVASQGSQGNALDSHRRGLLGAMPSAALGVVMGGAMGCYGGH